METPTHVAFAWSDNPRGTPLPLRVLRLRFADKRVELVTFAELDARFGAAERARVVRLAIRGGTMNRTGRQRWQRWGAVLSLVSVPRR